VLFQEGRDGDDREMMNDAELHIATKPQAAAGLRPHPCWSCRGPVEGAALFCTTCRAVQPPAPMTHFARLGLPEDFGIDAAELDRRYFAAQRQLHPDRFATKTPRERAISQSQAVSLNEAYETLMEPVSRAAYLLKLKGVDANPDGCHTVKDPALLMEQMEFREALQDADTQEAVNTFGAEAAAQMKASIAAVAESFRCGDLERAGHDTTRLKYLVKLVDEARAKAARLAGRGTR
jgi:molecular chaperone HscB